ncbi:hypothetical protein EC957_009017 [Mortierella hygrophila]|uniref:Uncharacterized protein n=1 Tax=Mortierella hygrophila TaxID=979708 RepID=A0A9P6FAR4_9FUNG|nr:hypothetical protein EC957_009017 [Mortierella hygrophila]
MVGSSRYNGPGAALRGQTRAPRQRSRPGDDSSSVISNDYPVDSSPSGQTDRVAQRTGKIQEHRHLAIQTSSAPALTNNPTNVSGPTPRPSKVVHFLLAITNLIKDLIATITSLLTWVLHPDHLSLHLLAPPRLLPPRLISPINTLTHGHGGGQGNNPYNNGPRSAAGNGYNSHYDQSPMMSPGSPDSWRSPPSGPRGGGGGYTPQTQYAPSTQYQPQRDDYGRSRGGYPQESDSDDYYSRQGGSVVSGYGPGPRHDQGPGRYQQDDRGRTLSYSTSIASNTSSVLAARRARNERNERSQRQNNAQADEWLTSPTGTENDTEILPWSDDEAIVTKAIRSPPTGYSNEKHLPPIPRGGGGGTQQLPAQQTRDMYSGQPTSGRKMDSDMIKVEVGGTTTVIPTSPDAGPGINFIKNVSPPNSLSTNYGAQSQGLTGASQSITGAATSLRAAAVFSEQKTNVAEQQSPTTSRPFNRRTSSEWGGQRISLDDMLAAPSPLTRDDQQQAKNSWQASPPLRARGGGSSTFTDMKSKRRSSLPDKFVPDWNEHAQAWRSSIGQKRTSWLASGKGTHDDDDQKEVKGKDDFLKENRQWADRMGDVKKAAPSDSKRFSDQSSLHRRSRSWSPRPPISRSGSNKQKDTALGRYIQVTVEIHFKRQAVKRQQEFPFQLPVKIPLSLSRTLQIALKITCSFQEVSFPLSLPFSNMNDIAPGGRPSADLDTPRRKSDRYSWETNDDNNNNKELQRLSWESASPMPLPLTKEMPKEDVVRKPPGGGLLSDSDSDSMDSPPLKVQYSRRPIHDDDDDDKSTISSKHPISIISTFNLPPATSPTSPPVMPPLPVPSSPTDTKEANGMMGASTRDYLDYKPMAPPPIPPSPPQAPQQNQTMMTSVTTVSIEATTATISNSRVSVDSFKNVPGQTGANNSNRNLDLTDTELDTDFDTDNESVVPGRRNAPPTPIRTTQLTRNESTTSSISVLSARSNKSFMSSSSSILSGSPPPQRAPPPIPGSDSGAGGAAAAAAAVAVVGAAAVVGSGLFGGAKRSASGGSARGVRSGLSKQILPPAGPPPPPAGPPPSSDIGATGNKPSYGILPPPIPSSFTEPSSVATVASVAVVPTTAAIQIQMLADDDQSRSQMGAISMETDDRLLTRLNNRVAQLEKELEFAQQDLEASQDDAIELQNKVRDLELELEEQSAKAGAISSEQHRGLEQEHASAKSAWDTERDQLLRSLEQLREDHLDDLETNLDLQRSKHGRVLDDLKAEHAAALLAEQDLLHEKHTRALDDQEDRLKREHQDAIDELLGQLDAMQAKHADALRDQQSEHEAKALENDERWRSQLENADDALENKSKELAAIAVAHQQALEAHEHQLSEKDLVLIKSTADREQAVKDLEHHKKETELALDRLEGVLAEDKQAHAELIKDLESKSMRLEGRIAELEGELQELMQDNVQIVEEMQRREDSWAEERAMLRASASDGNQDQDARVHELHEQLVAMTESKRQADSQFQGIVKGLLREASTHKKELESTRKENESNREQLESHREQLESNREQLELNREQLEQERQTREEMVQQLEKIHQELVGIQQERQALQQERHTLQQDNESLHQQYQSLQQEIQSLQEERRSLQEKERSLLEQKDHAEQKWNTLERSQQDLETRYETQKRSGSEAVMAIQRELEDRLKELEQVLSNEQAKAQELERALNQTQAKASKDMQQEQFTAQTRFDQVEAALKAKEAQVKKLEQEADATIKIQTDLLQSMERDAANSSKKLEASMMGKMKEMEKMFEEEKQRLQHQVHQELSQSYEQETLERETRLQQQLDSIHQQELSMARQEVSSKYEQQLQQSKQQFEQQLQASREQVQVLKQQYEQQMQAIKQQQEAALEQTTQSLVQQSKAMEEQLEKLKEEVESERLEREVAVKDRTYLERRVVGHDRRQKELESGLEAIQAELDQSRAKFGQDLQEVERSKMSLERKLGMAKEDVEELNKIRDELEGDRAELRKELSRLKKAGPAKGSGGGGGGDSAAWEAEKRGLKDQVRALEDEVQIMLEKNMNLTIELSMK